MIKEYEKFVKFAADLEYEHIELKKTFKVNSERSYGNMLGEMLAQLEVLQDIAERVFDVCRIKFTDDVRKELSNRK